MVPVMVRLVVASAPMEALFAGTDAGRPACWCAGELRSAPAPTSRPLSTMISLAGIRDAQVA